MCDWRKLPRRVTSRPEIEISDKRLAFSSQTSSIEPSYKTAPKQVKMSISQKVQGFLKIFRVQNVALTVRRPKHPSLVWCIGIFLCETFSRLVPRDPNLAHHTAVALGHKIQHVKIRRCDELHWYIHTCTGQNSI